MAADREEEEDHHLSPPSKHPRLISSDTTQGGTGAVTMALPSPLTLGLRLGLGNGAGNGNGNANNGHNAVKPAFTFMQLQELEHQALIYKYMSAGVPVPVHLVLPIWKSLAASSFGPHHFPSLMGLGSLCFDYRNSMEPEPGRCRRTDGKKWRCSRDIVPGQKYCERHVHRGRGRSRKPVENGTTGPSSSVPSSAAHLHAGSRPMDQNGITDDNTAAPPMHFLARASGTGDRVSPPRLGFSPTSVLQNAAGVCRTGQVN